MAVGVRQVMAWPILNLEAAVDAGICACHDGPHNPLAKTFTYVLAAPVFSILARIVYNGLIAEPGGVVPYLLGDFSLGIVVVAKSGEPGAKLPMVPASAHSSDEHRSNRLGAFLCWAVVFADIGTSVYYVPGILYGQVGKLAGLFVIMTLVVFLLLTLKYAEVSVRFPEGGGVVTVAAHGLNPWAGAVGGMFILVDYFLTSAISSLSGLQYFQTVIPALAPYVLVSTVFVVLLLGVLNWYGIKESAIFSASIAVVAFISDIVIICCVFLRVPPHIIGLVFQEMFSGHHLGVPTILTGFAGAFLAFSGLESISQLSPVMKTPRKKTVTWALAFVVVTVGTTSPLLTVFSTTLLTDPVILHATHAASSLSGGQPDPNQFISELAQAYGGTGLGILTAITASTLLIFACNTAIIGAYHVFLALARMQFFPKIVEQRNRLRNTPHISIALATGIPIVVLIAVRGDITLLGDMYAFGLLGAFSLTCLALDVMRWRERHGAAITQTHIEGDYHDDYAGAGVRQLLSHVLMTRLSPQLAVRVRSGYRCTVVVGQRTLHRMQPVILLLRQWWPDIKYYLGFVTTFLVCAAWLINLKSKPLATAFGGGFTILGVSIAVVYYRYQEREGRPPVFVMSTLQYLPDALVVVLTGTSEHNAQVIRAATEFADGNPLIYLYLGTPVYRDVQRLEFNDPYLFDQQAQDVLSRAALAAKHQDVPAQYVYRLGGPSTVLDAWRIVHPKEIIADAETAKAISTWLAPQYIRYQQVDGARIAHYFKRHVAGLDSPVEERNGPINGTTVSDPVQRQHGPGLASDGSNAALHAGDGVAHDKHMENGGGTSNRASSGQPHAK